MAKKILIKPFSTELMNAIDALIVVMNPQGKIVFMNRACEALTGFKLADIESKALFDIFILPEEVEAVKAVFADLVAHQENSKHTNYWRTASGGKRLISLSNTCLKDSKGKLDYIVGTGVDITDWKKDKRTLKERETKLQALFNAAPDSIVVIDGKGIIEETNPAFEHTFGYKPEDIIGKNITMLMPEPYKSEHNGYLANYHRTHEAKVIGTGREIEALHKDGHIVPIYLSISESSYNGNNHFTGIIRDITTSKLQEEKLRRAHKVEAIGQLTGGIAHDFNNLLTIILGNLEVLEGGPSNPEARDILKEVFDAIEQGSDLVSQLLAFGRRQSLSPKTVDICKIVKHLTHFLRRTLPENIEIVTQLEHDLWQCHADPSQIENALLNVVLNARACYAEWGENYY